MLAFRQSHNLNILLFIVMGNYSILFFPHTETYIVYPLVPQNVFSELQEPALNGDSNVPIEEVHMSDV
jgi:hypothetical protein